jgi:hypothetical protein
MFEVRKCRRLNRVKLLIRDRIVNAIEHVANRTAVPSQGKLGFWMATALVVGNMIGSGIFLLPASLDPYGGISIIGWLSTSAGAICLAL